MASNTENDSARDINVPTKDDELRTLVIEQLSSPLRQEDRADVIMRAVAVYGDQRECEGRIEAATDIRGAVLFTQEKPFPQWLDDYIAALKDKETKQ